MKLFRLLQIAALFVAAVLVTGCAAPSRQMYGPSVKPDVSSKSLFLMAVTFKNNYKDRFQPRLDGVVIERLGAGKAETIRFAMDNAGLIWEGKDNDRARHLVRMELEPGEYEIRGFNARASGFPVVASFFAPLHAPVKSAVPGVYYLGQVEATVRERQGDEFRAGPPLPVLDQAIGGASGGTFDVQIIDAFPLDKEHFLKWFPLLSQSQITVQLLPPFDRAKAQKWWEAN